MRVQDIMTSGVVTIRAGESIEAARNLMRQQAIRHLVVKDGDVVTGVLSARDLPRGRGSGPLVTVAEAMSRTVVTTAPTTTVKAAANLMRGRSIGSLVVVQADRPVGIITVADLLEFIGRGGARTTRTTTRPVLHHRVPHRKRQAAAGAW